jgi:hypothetical protein
MRRALVVLTTAATLAVGTAGPAAAGPPRDTQDVNCRPGTQCLFLKTGWTFPPGRRNVGG